jgi:hypothetical protein
MEHLFPERLSTLLFSPLKSSRSILRVNVPVECLAEKWCTWPANTAYTRAALKSAPLFALVAARMIWCQWLTHELAYSHPHREMVYLVTLYMDQHIPLILACEKAGISKMKTLSDMHKFARENSLADLSLFEFESLLPEGIVPFCEDTTPPDLIGPQTLFLGNSKDPLAHVFEKAFPKRCFSREMEQATVDLLRAGDNRVLHLYLCSLLGNYADAGFRLSLGPRIQLLSGTRAGLVKRAEAWAPSASHAIREYVARNQLQPSPYTTVMGWVLRDFSRYWRNVIMACEAAVRPNVEHLLQNPGTRPQIKEDVAVWTKHASHNVSLPKRREVSHGHLLRLIGRRFPTSEPAECALEPGLHAQFLHMLALDLGQEPARTAARDAVNALCAEEVPALLHFLYKTRTHLEKRRMLAFYPLPHNYWDLHKKAPPTVHQFCPACYTISFAVAGVQTKAANFVVRCHKGVYERVCDCVPGGVRVCKIDMRGYIMSARKTRALMCCECFAITRVQDGSFHVGKCLFLCTRCVRIKALHASTGATSPV